MAGVVKVGPWGGDGGSPWDMGVASSITKVHIRAGWIIDAIQIEYVVDGTPAETHRHGGPGGNLYQFELKEGEYLVSMSGYVQEFYGTPCVSQLTFVTNLGNTHGAYGRGGGTPFSLPVAEGQIVGFFGRSDNYLNALGVYLAPN